MLVLADKNSCWPDDVFCRLVAALSRLHRLHAGAHDVVFSLRQVLGAPAARPSAVPSEHPHLQCSSSPVSILSGAVPGSRCGLEGKPDWEERVLGLSSQGL